MGENRKLKVLIIDDEPGTRDLLSMLLRHEVSASPESAVDCATARLLLSSSSFDLVTLDYRLPDGDGLEFLGEIESMDNPPPVIMVTGYGDEKTAANALKMGAAGYVVKDKSLDSQLIEEVKAALVRRELQRVKRELEESRDKYQQIFENIKSGVAVYKAVDDGEDFVFTDFNKGAETIENIDRRDLLGKLVSEAFPGVKEFGLFEVLQRVWHTGEPERFPVTFYVDGQTSGWRDNYVYKLPGGEIVAIYEDVTEQKKLEELLNAVVERLPGAVIVTDNSGKIILVNKAMTELFGRDVPGESSLDTLRGRFYKTYRAGTDQPYPLEKAPITRALRGERSTADDIEMEAGGVRRRLEITAIPIFGKGGAVMYAVALSRDITRQKKVECELIDSESRLRELYDSSVEGIGVFDAGGKIEYVNPRFAEMFGYDCTEEVLGLNVAEFCVSKSDYEALREMLMEKGTVQGYEVNVRRKDDRAFWVLANTTMYKDDQGNPSRTAVFLTDITERKKAEEELKRVNEELAAYAHTISHDLKGPLGAIGIAVNLLDPDAVELKDGDSEEVLEIIRRNTRIAQTRVEKILKLAESGQTPTEVEEVNVREVVGEILEVMSLQIEAKGITVNVDSEMGRLMANRLQIEQLFSNLISNAVKHNNNSDKPEIWITYLGDKGGAHRYRVKDNGDGVQPAQFDKLFDPFRKGGKTGEAGLGLSIARKIVSVYNGDIRARNDNGACFEFELRDFAKPAK